MTARRRAIRRPHGDVLGHRVGHRPGAPPHTIGDIAVAVEVAVVRTAIVATAVTAVVVRVKTVMGSTGPQAIVMMGERAAPLPRVLEEEEEEEGKEDRMLWMKRR